MPDTDQLRDQVADAIARAHVQTSATVHPLMEDYRAAADAVMEIVTADQERRRAQARLRVDQARKIGRQEGIAELVAHLGDVAAGARAGRAEAYPEEAERMGPTRWCLVTDRAHRLAARYADGQGAPVPDATQRATELQRQMHREQVRHATEVLALQARIAELEADAGESPEHLPGEDTHHMVWEVLAPKARTDGEATQWASEIVRAFKPDRDQVLRIVADHVHRSATYGGLDTGDLVSELEQAGYTLPRTLTDTTTGKDTQ